MRRFKRKTLALIIASYIAIVGASGAETYRNSLMSLNFAGSSDSEIVLNLLTQEGYQRVPNIIKRAKNTYIMLLPETDSKILNDIQYDKNIADVQIRTMPYSGQNTGYTKITIKTKKDIPIDVNAGIYAGDLLSLDSDTEKMDTKIQSQFKTNKNFSNSIYSQTGVDQISPVDIEDSMHQFDYDDSKSKNDEQTTSYSKYSKVKPKKKIINHNAKKTFIPGYTNTQNVEKTKDKKDITYVLLISLLVAISSVFLIAKTKSKIVEITGESGNYDISDDDKKSKKEKKNNISVTINNLDKKYSKDTSVSISNKPKILSDIKSTNVTNSNDYNYEDDDSEIIDLDDLLKDEKPSKVVQQPIVEEKNVQEESNTALDEFLESFDFDLAQEEMATKVSENEVVEEAEEESFNEELYEECINNNNIEFTSDDVDKLHILMGSEITDDTLENLSDFVSKPEIIKQPTAFERLEHFVTLYTVQQNISFTKNDVDSLYKLISVELDNSFINDLRTNPKRINEMREEIEKQKSRPHKTSEILTLNVKDMLPDLSEALKKQGNKKIQSEVKPEVVYFSEGYDVSTLSLDDELPDLSKEVNNDNAYQAKPSAMIQLVDNSYEVKKLAVDDNLLPDLDDAINNPEKYEDVEEEVIVDEDALLKNISNVNFVPFAEEYDKTVQNEKNLTVGDVQNEFEQLDENFEIVNSDDEILPDSKDELDDFESLYNGNYVDFDNNYGQQNIDILNHEDVKQEIFSKGLSYEVLKNIQKEHSDIAFFNKDNNSDDSSSKKSVKEDIDINALMNKIKDSETRRKSLNESINALRQIKKDGSNDKETILSEICVLDGERFSIVSACNFTNNLGCYLAKNEEGYAILGFVGEKIFKVKSYDKLNTEKIQSRVSDKFSDGTLQYIVRIGIHKFIMNVRADGMEFVMDLC